MGFFSEHIRKRERFICKYFTIYNPSKIQEKELIDMMESSMKQVEDENGELQVQGNFSYSLIKWIITELTNIEEDFSEISDEEFVQMIEEGDEIVEELMHQIKQLLTYYGNKIVREQETLIETIEQTIDLFTVGAKLDSTKDKISKLFKKKGVDLPADECLKLLGKPEELKKVLEEAEKNKKKKTTHKTTKKKSNN